MPLLESTRRLQTIGLAASTARLTRGLQHPRRTQRRVLRNMLECLVETEIGRRHRLAGVDSVEAFRDRVAPTTRDELRFDLERTVAGEPDVLVRGRAIGARATMSAAPRGVLVPLTAQCRGRGPRDASAAWVAGLLRRRPRILGGEVLVLPPVRPPVSLAARSAEAGTRIGHIVDVLPASMRRRLAVPTRLLVGGPGEELAAGARRRLIMRLALARDVRLVIGGDPAELATCFGAADEVAESIIRDIRDGTFTAAGDLPAVMRSQLAARFPADRDRARALDRGRDVRDGRLLPVEAWSLEAVACLAQGREVTLRARLDPWLDPWRRGRGPVVVDLGVLTTEAHLVHAAVVRPDAEITHRAPDAADGDAGGETPPPPAAVENVDGRSADDAGGLATATMPRSAESSDAPLGIEILGRPNPRPWSEEEPMPGPMLVGAGPPMLESAFLEFVALEELEGTPDAPERWTFHEIDELEAARRYAVFVTTTGGLLRTETRDAVEVVGHAGRTPFLRYRGRTPGILEGVT